MDLEAEGVDDCFCGDQSADLRTKLAEADNDYNGVRVSEEDSASTGSVSETDTPLQSLTELPNLSPKKSPLDVSEAAKLEQFYT